MLSTVNSDDEDDGGDVDDDNDDDDDDDDEGIPVITVQLLILSNFPCHHTACRWIHGDCRAHGRICRENFSSF